MTDTMPNRAGIPALHPNTILLCEVGSGAHGTGIPGGEDHDELGIVVETTGDVYGLTDGMRTRMYRTQPEGVRSGPGDTDRTMYPLRKWLRLAVNGNPSIMLALWAPVEMSTSAGNQLRGHADWFVGRHIIPAYQGYMRGQVLRILGEKRSGHGRRGGGGRTELIEAHGYDTKYAMHAARLGFQCLELMETGRLALPIPDPAGQWLRDVRSGLVEFDEWWQTVLELDEKMHQARFDESVRPDADRSAIVEWSIDTHLHYAE
jgi:hypothetical protein